MSHSEPARGRVRPSTQFRLFAAIVLLSLPALAYARSIGYFVNDPNDYDYGEQTDLPAGFGDGEFTLELWIKPDDSFPVGSTSGGAEQLNNWSDFDPAPLSSTDWWFAGNFLLDGHNNNGFSNGTFSLQFYGGGRLRWLFGDGVSPGAGGLHAVQAFPATSAPLLLDGAWHQVTLVRRWSGVSTADLEMWIDGAMIDATTTSARTDMAATYWDNWTGFPPGQLGWFWGAEKQAAVGILSQYEDYKGLIDELRFWSRAKTASEIMNGFAASVTGMEPGLVGVYHFEESSGSTSCDTLNPAECIQHTNTKPGFFSTENAPLGGAATPTPSPTPVLNAIGRWKSYD